MPRPRRVVPNSPEAVFDPVHLRQLRRLLDSTAATLIPAFADATARFAALQRETAAAAAKRRNTAKIHAKGMKKLERLIGSLLTELTAARLLTTAAVEAGYILVPPRSGTFGQLGTIAQAERDFEMLRNAATIVAARAGEWRRRPEADSRRKRGRKVGDRQQLADWVAERLNRAGPTCHQGEERCARAYAQRPL
jgi:hypothetical protein